MRVIGTPSTCSSFAPVKCGMVPLLGTPNVALLGLALSQATNPLKSVASTAGPTTMPNSKRAGSDTGTKSLFRSKLGLFSTMGNTYIVGPVVTRIVAPSGLAFLTHLIPISPSPPVRFSTMTVRSSSRPTCWASRRQSVSPPPPAAKGKIILVGGPDSPNASLAIRDNDRPAQPAMKLRRSTVLSPTGALVDYIRVCSRLNPYQSCHRRHSQFRLRWSLVRLEPLSA